MCVGVSVWLGWSGIRTSAWNTDTTPTQPHRNSNTHRTKNNTTNVVIQQSSRKLVMMDILMSETCWAHKKWNKTARDIKFVFYSSTITMVHGPINIRYFRHICPSTRLHRTPVLPLDGFSWNFIYEYFSTICLENSNFVKIWQESRLLYMKTLCTFMVSPSILLRMSNFSDKSCRENQNTHFIFNNIFQVVVPCMR